MALSARETKKQQELVARSKRLRESTIAYRAKVKAKALQTYRAKMEREENSGSRSTIVN